jgi:hypothetical protein
LVQEDEANLQWNDKTYLTTFERSTKQTAMRANEMIPRRPQISKSQAAVALILYGKLVNSTTKEKKLGKI